MNYDTARKVFTAENAAGLGVLVVFGGEVGACSLLRRGRRGRGGRRMRAGLHGWGLDVTGDFLVKIGLVLHVMISPGRKGMALRPGPLLFLLTSCVQQHTVDDGMKTYVLH